MLTLSSYSAPPPAEAPAGGAGAGAGDPEEAQIESKYVSSLRRRSFVGPETDGVRAGSQLGRGHRQL